MCTHFKTQEDNPQMHLHINFHRLTLTRCSSYIKLPEWIAKKKVVLKPENKDKSALNELLFAVLDHEEIAQAPQHISKLQHSENQYKWKEVEFLKAI